MRLLKACLRDEHGQDITEYTLLVAFVAICAAALLLMNQGAVDSIWGNANTNLDTARAFSS